MNTGADAPTSPRRLLVVEDDVRVASFMVEGLRGEGYEVQHAGSAAAALALDQTQPFDLVLLDPMLPDRSGLTVAKSWRDAGRSMPIVMLTERDGVEDRRAAFGAGATAFLAKPFKFEELLSQIAALCPGSSRPLRGSCQRVPVPPSDPG